MTERNVYVDGTWYGPDYPDSGQPPADKVDGQFLGRKVDEPVADGDFVGMKAVTEPDEAAQFGSPVPVEVTSERDAPTGEVEPVGIKAVKTQEEAAAFRGEPAKSTAKGAGSRVEPADTPGAAAKTDAKTDAKADEPARSAVKPAAVRRTGK